MVDALGNDPIARSRAADLTIDLNYGMRSSRSRAKPPCRIGLLLADLLWIGITDEPQTAELAAWCLKASIERPDLKKGKFLTAESLLLETQNGECPAAIDGEDFARAVFLFGTHLPRDEAITLFNQAATLGCHLLRIEDQGQARLGEPIYTEVPTRAHAPAKEPRLVDSAGQSEASRVLPADEALIAGFQRAADANLSARETASKAFAGEILHFVDGPLSDWQEAAGTVEAARSAAAALAQARKSITQRIGMLKKSVAETVGANMLLDGLGERDDVLPISLRDFSVIAQALASNPPDSWVLSAWEEGLGAQVAIDDLHRLTLMSAEWHASRMAHAEFLVAAAGFLRISEPQKVAAWLSELSGEELALLSRDLHCEPWTIGSAILLRAALDENSGSAKRLVIETLSGEDDVDRRRMIMRFIDPSIIDGPLPLQRIIAAEKFRDIFHFGPLALLSDPTSGIPDASIVGRPISALSEFISANLGIVSAGNELQRLLRPGDQQANAERALVEFIHAPVTLGGLFRQLREHARENVLKPILKAGRPNVFAVKQLAASLETEAVGDRIFADVQAQNPTQRLEARHRAQLDRYLSSAQRYVQDFLVESRAAPEPKVQQFSRELANLVALFRNGGPVGTVEWLEGQALAILQGHAAAPRDPTLIGASAKIFKQAWETQCGSFSDDGLDLPEFHIEGALTFLDIAASVLCWRHRGHVPTRRDIVEDLVSRREFSAALNCADEGDDDLLKDYVRSAAGPIISELNERYTVLINSFGQELIDKLDSAIEFNYAISILALERAAELLELLELELDDAAASALDAGSVSSREKLAAFLNEAGAVGVSVQSPLRDLEQRWESELRRRVDERQHLITLEKEMACIAAKLAQVGERLGEFQQGNLLARRWLPPDVANDFAEIASAAVSQMVSWAASASFIPSEERWALTSLCVWFMQYCSEQSETLHSLEDPIFVRSTLERILAVSAEISSAQSPSEALSLLSDLGESVPYGELGESPESAKKTGDFNDSKEDHGLPEKVSSAVREERWQELTQILTTAIQNKSEELDLTDLAASAQAFTDESPIPSEETVEHFVSAAAWLSDIDATRLLPEHRRIDLAFRLFSGVLANDTGHDFPRTPTKDGSWSSLFSKNSPLRRLLQAGLPNRSARVLEHLSNGTLSVPVAQRLWDAVTTGNDPQLVRTPLLQFIHDHGGREAILRLATQHDPGIAERLEQLFDTRAAAANRPDLVSVAQVLVDQIASAARSAPFRDFVRALPTAAEHVRPTLEASIEDGLWLRSEKQAREGLNVPVLVRPVGLVPAKLEAALFAEDDISFADGSRRQTLSNNPLYFAADFNLQLRFGPSWFETEQLPRRDTLRLRINAKTVTGEVQSADLACQVRSSARSKGISPVLDTDTLLEGYPGVNNTPAIDDTFIGRINELERLQQILLAARRPSPVVLTGMRRIGKTSLLFAFHKRLRHPGAADAITIYLSLAERKVELEKVDQTVSHTIFRAIRHALVRKHPSPEDLNLEMCTLIRERFAGDWRKARAAIDDCFDEESLADSITAVSRLIMEMVGNSKVRRVVFLIDEAEALVLPYQLGGHKRTELEQLLQSLREISQRHDSVGLLLSGSNHINVFTREYKNAFFGSSQVLELTGLSNINDAKSILCPASIAPFVQFEESATEAALELCAGMPQFLWQIGATTSYIVRSGIATRADIRSAVSMLVGEGKASLPFKSYDVLEPIENMLQLVNPRERNLLWMLLFRVASSSSLVAPAASTLSILDPTLLGLDDKAAWTKRLLSLVELRILTVNAASYRFSVPLFAEGFRAPKNWQEFDVRLQKVMQ